MAEERLTPETVTLGPTESAHGRPFTAVELLQHDHEVLREILADLRTRLHAHLAGRSPLPVHTVVDQQVDGRTMRHVMCNELRLRTHPALCVVGFFGERHIELDVTPLEEANAALVRDFRNYPGITSYSSRELPSGQWANLVLHDDPVDTEFWRRSELHARAVDALSPVYYRNVRIHNARLTAAVPDAPDIVVHSTKYFDFSDGSGWRATREFAG